ncbi:MAG: sigma-54-dependent Fis family transcriptional regulator [Planctomycetota bacterium]|nr:MAG: sigma-54-dependent Fis family transcriptional regulator [Planctomycetota bacterium]
MSTVLVVDDKEMMRDSVGSSLRRAGFDVVTSDRAQAAVERIAQKRPDVIITDLKMPGMTGLELLEKIREIDDEVPVVLMTAFGTIETAVEAMRLGAFDYITKPFEGDELIITVKRAVAHARIVRENTLLRLEARAVDAAAPGSAPLVSGAKRLVGESAEMQRVRQQVNAVAGSQGTVLISGESGSGKEVVARAIHESSDRRERPFLAVNCAALSESLLESELFGHERGAFTGADQTRKGRFELADGGTLLLDEVSEVSPQVQAKLLRVLQERSFERVGSSVTIGVDVRVLATSNRDLPQSVADGQFRQDLFFRLNVLPIHVPPLRDRPEDVEALVRHCFDRFSERERSGEIAIEPGVMELLGSYNWPGNVRELQNVCERAVVLLAARARSGEPGARVLTRSMVEPWLRTVSPNPSQGHPGSNGAAAAKPLSLVHGRDRRRGRAPRRKRERAPMVEPKPLPAAGVRKLEDIEREAIIETLQRFNGHRQKTAAALGIGVRTLGLKLRKWKDLRLVEPSL